tara:strand:- start:97 stop:543 length:447 start_codon:yes stop_codon:yes gene_type:complete
MINIKLKCDKSINKKLKTYKIPKRKLENILTLLVNDKCKTRKWWWYDIKICGINDTSSGYVWGSDKMEIALRSHDCKNQKERKLYFIQSIVHEFRHWVQDQIEKVPSKALNYTERDTENLTKKYLDNKYEKEARVWEDKVEGMLDFLK